MRSLRCILVIASLASLAGCASPPQSAQADERDVVMMETRKSLWDDDRDSPGYSRDRSINRHRLFCMDHSGDISCAGWNWRAATTTQLSAQ